MIKVLLVDDHELVRSGVAALLNAVDDFSVFRACGSGEEALTFMQDHQPNVVLMDIKMPGIGGEEACRRILKKYPLTKVIALSICDTGPVPQRLLKMGVQGFISKGSSLEETVNAIRTVMAGRRYLCAEVANNLVFQGLEEDSDSPFVKLSQRESQVVDLILQGKSIKEMSDILIISDKTVNTYRYRLYEKLHVKNDVELTRLAVRFNLLESI